MNLGHTDRHRHLDPRRSLLFVAALVTALALVALIPGAATPARADDTPPLPDVTDADGRLGTCYAFYTVGETLLSPKAYAAGSRWDRFDFRWNVIEGEEHRQNPFFFTAHDQIVDRDIAHGIDIVGILGSTPEWAAPDCAVAATAARPAESATALGVDDVAWWRPCPPPGLDLPWDDPGNIWGNYVYKTVTHFKDRVHVWEMWNEPDIQGVFWSGTPEQYAQLLKVGYLAAKAADPDATVLFGGLAYYYDRGFYVDVLRALAAMPDGSEHNYYFDAMSLHLYSSIYHIGPIAAEIRDNMASRVGPHPIWLTETGVPIWSEYGSANDAFKVNRATTQEAADYVIEGYAEALAAGIEKFFFFRTHDDGMTDYWNQPQHFGLIRDDLSLRPSYVAFQVAASYMQGENQVTGPFNENGVRRVTMWGTPRGRIDILWQIDGGEPITATPPAVLPTATLVNVRGETRTLQADDGLFNVKLEPATANTGESGEFIIGGSPILIIQEDTILPTSALQPIPTLIHGDTFTLTWTAADEGAGLWYTEIQRARQPGGPWMPLVGWGETEGKSATTVQVPDAGTWYFRARARDRAGNYEVWPGTAEISTYVNLTRTVTLSVNAFVDTNSNNLWDDDEVPATAAELAWRKIDGTLISETIGATWAAEMPVRFGDYSVTATAPGYLPDRAQFSVPPGDTSITITLNLGVKEIRTQLHMPVISRND